MKKLSLVLVLTVISWSAMAQSIDMARMNRDLEIAENILSTLSNDNSKGNFYFGDRTEGSYLEGYGVIFSMPKNNFIIRSDGGSNVAFVAPSSEGFSYRVNSNSNNNEEVVIKEVKKAKEKQEAWEKESEIKTLEAMKTFLVDYADLIGQLKSTDKVMVTVKNKPFAVVWTDGVSKKEPAMSQSAEIKKSDITAYKQGKINREQALAKIVITEKKVDAERDRDLEIFTSIFSRLYEPDFSSTYYSMKHMLNYERLNNFGVIFNMKVYSSNSDNGLHTIRTTGESGLTQEERNEKVEAMYVEFEKTLKENIVDYGRTISSLKPEEILMFKVKLTECNGCDMPKTIEITVKASVLAAYNSGKLSKEKVLDQVKVNKG